MAPPGLGGSPDTASRDPSSLAVLPALGLPLRMSSSGEAAEGGRATLAPPGASSCPAVPPSFLQALSAPRFLGLTDSNLPQRFLGIISLLGSTRWQGEGTQPAGGLPGPVKQWPCPRATDTQTCPVVLGSQPGPHLGSQFTVTSAAFHHQGL